MRLYVKCLADNDASDFDTWIFDGSFKTFGDLKKRIHEEKGIPISEQRLMFNARERSSETFMTYQGSIPGQSKPQGNGIDVQTESTIFLVLRMEEISLNITTPGATSCEVRVLPARSVRALKVQIEAQLGVPVDEQCLMLSTGETLKDHMLVSAYGLTAASSLHLVRLQLLRNAAEALKDDRDYVLAVVSTTGSELQYASDALRMDQEVCIAAVSSDFRAMQHILSQPISAEFRATIFNKRNNIAREHEVLLAAATNLNTHLASLEEGQGETDPESDTYTPHSFYNQVRMLLDVPSLLPLSPLLLTPPPLTLPIRTPAQSADRTTTASPG
jgi:hypothetical protein